MGITLLALLFESPGRGPKERAQNGEEKALDKVFLMILGPKGSGRTPGESHALGHLLYSSLQEH